ncbi:MAG: hypothetical protein V4660_16535 [Pseudomonadota bacterium]
MNLSTSRSTTITINRNYFVIFSFILFCAGFTTRHFISTSENTALDDRTLTANKNSDEKIKPVAVVKENDPIDAFTMDARAQNKDKNKKSDINILIQSILTMERDEKLYFDIIKEINSLTLQEKKQLLLAALNENGSSNFEAIIGAILTKIAAEQPMESIAIFSELPTEHRKLHGQSFIYNLAKSDPQITWDWLSTLNDEQVISADDQFKYQASVLHQMANIPEMQKAAFENAKLYPGSEKAGALKNIVIKQVAQQNIDLAVELAISDGTKDYATVGSLLEIWIKKDFEASYAFMNSHRDKVPQHYIKQISQTLLSRGNSQEFQTLYNQTDGARAQDELAHLAASHFIEKDIEESVRWISKINSPERKFRAGLSAIKDSSNAHRIDEHLQFIDKCFGKNETEARLQLYSYTLKELSKTDPEKVSSILNSLKDDEPRLYNSLHPQFMD